MDKVIKYIKDNIILIIMFVCVISFLVLAEDVFNKELMNGDIIGYNIVSSVIEDTLTPLMILITNLGGVYVIGFISITMLLFNLKNNIGILVCSNLVLVTGLNLLLKNILQRTRPIEFRIVDASGYSFPSGHSMVAMAFYGFIIYLTYLKVKNVKLKYCLMMILLVLICMIGISRIYLGVHYTSDVLGGFCISLAYLIIFIRCCKGKIR